jgi:hypothetical protein
MYCWKLFVQTMNSKSQLTAVISFVLFNTEQSGKKIAAKVIAKKDVYFITATCNTSY